jgi:DNA topoisomerase-1
VYEEAKEENNKENGDAEGGSARLPEVSEGQTLKLNELKPEQHFTQPPPRYSEAALVKELEQKGIGRPSTYASILSTIVERQYVEKIKLKFYPTQLGEIIFNLLIKSFADIFDLAYTARMEEELDEIEEGKMHWTEALDEFYGKFSVDLERAGDEMDNYKAGQPTEETCEQCGKPMLLRMGRNGLFVACSGYPECTNTREPKYERPFADIPEHHEGDPEICDNCGREMVIKRGRFGQFWACKGYPDCQTAKPIHATGQPAAPQPTGEKCPECGEEMVRRNGRFGPFVACSGFPKCKYVKQNTIGIKCPECGEGDLAERRGGKRGNVFYGCVRYPECKYTTSHKPVKETCPDCKAELTYEKRTKKGFFRYCKTEDCHFEVELADPDGVEAEVPATATAD